MSTKQLIKDIADLKGIALTDDEVTDINTKIACVYLDELLDKQAKQMCVLNPSAPCTHCGKCDKMTDAEIKRARNKSTSK